MSRSSGEGLVVSDSDDDQPLTREAWQELAGLSEHDWESGVALARALELWCRENGALEAAVYAPSGEGQWLLVERSRDGGPEAARSRRPGSRLASRSVATSCPIDHLPDAPRVELPGGFCLAYRPLAEAPALPSLGGFALLLSAAVRLQQLHSRLRDRMFQENYNVVTLESLYEVGLRIASTLNLTELSGEILLRAVSLLDARRGALFLLEADAFELDRTIGGDARTSIPRADPSAQAMLKGGPAPADLLPGACHVLAVPIAVESSIKGILVIGDKESRTGVGPFVEGDRRALTLFANQAAIALENARLHRQALEMERLQRELELAAEIQRGILPTEMPRIESFEIAGWNRPTQQVGGDYYGSLSLADGRTAVVVADVTGKGMPAALLVSTLHSALHLLLDRVEPSPELLARLNQHIGESSGSNKFITMILAIVDPNSRALGFLNAGHNPGLLVRAEGDVEELAPGGLPLGLLAGSEYRLDSFDLGRGDLVCLYSDGITECESPAEEEFGADRLASFLIEHRALPLEEIISTLDRQVSEFVCERPQGDDQTVVLLRYCPGP